MDRVPYALVVQPLAKAELEQLRVFEQRRISDAIRANLLFEPFRPSRHRKPTTVVPTFEHKLPVWEIRVGEFRVFYDGSAESRTVFVRAIRHKPAGKTTEEITR